MRKLICTAALCAAACASGQGTFIFDQQSSTDEGAPGYGSGPEIHSLLPYTGQSFTPGLAGIDFIRLKFDDGATGDGVGASIYLNLRSGSIAGTILGTTATVNMPNGFDSTATFFFPGRISLTPEATYYFELVLQSGVSWRVDVSSYSYSGGEAFANGSPWPGGDYWFREGLYVVPEPSASALGLLGAAMLAFVRRQQ